MTTKILMALHGTYYQKESIFSVVSKLQEVSVQLTKDYTDMISHLNQHGPYNGIIASKELSIVNNIAIDDMTDVYQKLSETNKAYSNIGIPICGVPIVTVSHKTNEETISQYSNIEFKVITNGKIKGTFQQTRSVTQNSGIWFDAYMLLVNEINREVKK